MTHYQLGAASFTFLLAFIVFGLLVMVVPRRDERRVVYVAIACLLFSFWLGVAWFATAPSLAVPS